MFKGLGDLANLGSMIRDMQQMGGKLEALKERLRTLRVSGSSGAGMVVVQANGLAELVEVKIEPSLVERGEREMIEDLVRAAVNQALEKSRELHAQEMRSLADGFNMPGIQDALSNLLGGSK